MIEAAATQAKAAPDNAALQAQSQQANETAGTAIETYIQAQNLSVSGLDVKFDGASGTVTVSGEAADQATREKVVLCCGNVNGVASVNDQMTVKAPACRAGCAPTFHGSTRMSM